jgi:hypothetical protein
MKPHNAQTLLLATFLLTRCLGDDTYSAAQSPALLKAKQEVETKGFVF